MPKESVKRYQMMVSLVVAEGSFNSVNDVMDYIRYRLALRSRDTDSVRLEDLILLSETNVQLELKS